MSGTKPTPGPWYVRDFRASEMRRLGWKGPSIDRILITNKTGAEILESAGEDCVIARIQFDNRPDELTEGNFADASLIVRAVNCHADLVAALEAYEREREDMEDRAPTYPGCIECNLGTGPHKKTCAHHLARAALAKAGGTE